MLRWLYPSVCELCGAYRDTQHSLCASCCDTRVPRIPKPICLYCGSPVYMRLDDPWECPQCEDKIRSFDFARAAFYGNEEMLELMHRYKYGRETHFARAFALLMKEQWEQHPILALRRDWTLIPVPVTRRKLFHRRFNQSLLLAEELRRLIPELHLAQPLQRLTSEVHSQTILSAQQRMLNANKIYKLREIYKGGGSRQLPSAHLVLIDDVYTTGSTLRACAQELKKIASVEQIVVLTAMRAAL